MILAMTTWGRIREQFSDDEKAQLNAAIRGEILCPKGVVLKETKMRPELLEKLKMAIRPGPLPVGVKSSDAKADR
jgi:hypothetical protein